MPRSRPLTRWEMVGAWLRLWTPPREVDVPPPPKGKLALGAAVVLLLVAAAVVYFAPRIETGKKRHASAEARALARAKTRERRRLAAEQRLHTGRSSHSRSGRLQPPAERRLRKAVVRDVERSIAADVRSRIRGGLLKGPLRGASCEPYPRSLANVGPETTLKGTLGKYSCTAIQHYVPEGNGKRGLFGYPFWARVNFRTLTYAWCKINPRPGERTVGQELVRVRLPRGCDLGF